MDKLKDYFQNIRYASKIIFAASKKYFIFKMLLSILSSVLPYLPLFLWRELINALVDATFGEINSFLNKIFIIIQHYYII